MPATKPLNSPLRSRPGPRSGDKKSQKKNHFVIFSTLSLGTLCELDVNHPLFEFQLSTQCNKCWIFSKKKINAFYKVTKSTSNITKKKKKTLSSFLL